MNMVELTLIGDGRPVLVNIDNVSFIFGDGEGTKLYRLGSSDDWIRVKESYDEIKRLVLHIAPIWKK